MAREIFHHIVWLGSDRRLGPAEFGCKASLLTELPYIKSLTPRGFAISKELVQKVVDGSMMDEERLALADCFAHLIGNDRHSTAIVRSSSCIDDGSTHSFAGLFLTVRDVRSYEGLVEAILACAASSLADEVSMFAEMRGVTIPANHLAILVQRQVDIKRSALLQVHQDRSLCEEYKGDLADKIRGKGTPEHVFYIEGLSITELSLGAALPQPFTEHITSISEAVAQHLATKSPEINAVLEIAFDGENSYVLQYSEMDERHNVIGSASSSHLDLSSTPLGGLATQIGVKAAAMTYYQSQGLFPKKLLIEPPAPSGPSLRSSIHSLSEGKGLTVRFSKGQELGLPRAFVDDESTVVRLLDVGREKSWTTIIHPYIDVKYSYELLLDRNAILIELVPGIWESDNILDPDAILLYGPNARSWKYRKSRVAKFAGPKGYYNEPIESLTWNKLEEVVSRASDIASNLRSDLMAALPVNIHFVEDSVGDWHFLNLRKGFSIESLILRFLSPHIVSSVSDMERWNGLSPILLRFATDRGAENRIVEIAKRIPSGSSVLVDFGVLSHPAMILRELGHNPVPSYLSARSLKKPYEFRSWTLDQALDPITRIRAEEPLFFDGRLRVVNDRDPIAEGHKLLLTEANVESLADSDCHEDVLELMNGNRSNRISANKHLLVERGRAQFCTSGFTDKHAHAHLLPSQNLPASTAKNFAEFVGARFVGSLDDALQLAKRSCGEYFLVMDFTGETYFVSGSMLRTKDKRLIRRFFENIYEQE